MLGRAATSASPHPPAATRHLPFGRSRGRRMGTPHGAPSQVLPLLLTVRREPPFFSCPQVGRAVKAAYG